MSTGGRYLVNAVLGVDDLRGRHQGDAGARGDSGEEEHGWRLCSGLCSGDGLYCDCVPGMVFLVFTTCFFSFYDLFF